MDELEKSEAPSPLAVNVSTHEIPEGLSGWVGFVGIITIVSGASYILSCIGIFIGVFMVIAGIALMGGKSALDNITHADPLMIPFLEKLRTFMLMTGIVYIVTIALTIIGLTLYFGFIVALLSSIGNVPL
ncbi:MAG: hypothetical protein GKR87_03145 [Kiritimatiellae bacterium]|nr:hypothetical protein [Kiritimatiellia bacterium]